MVLSTRIGKGQLTRDVSDVVNAVTPKGLEVKVLEDLLPSESDFANLDTDAINGSLQRARKYIGFISDHPELAVVPRTTHLSESDRRILEDKLHGTITTRYPELFTGSSFSEERLKVRLDDVPSRWNPVAFLLMTQGDLSFYQGLEEGLQGTDMFMYLEKGGYETGAEVFVGIRPYGKRKERVRPFLQQLRHGSLIGFYGIGQARVDGNQVAVIEFMQTDLLRKRKDGRFFVPRNDRICYVGEHYKGEYTRWLDHTLPQLEDALSKTGVAAILIPTLETIMQVRTGEEYKLKDSKNAVALYQRPGGLGYDAGNFRVDFLVREDGFGPNFSVQGKYWVKFLK